MFARRMSSSAQDSKYDEKEDAAGVTATVAEVSDGSDGAPAGDEDGKFGSTSAAHRKLVSTAGKAARRGTAGPGKTSG